MQLPEGIAYSQLFWPNYRWRRPRNHHLAVLRSNLRDHQAILTTLEGERHVFTTDAGGYQQAASLAAREKLTVITRFNEGADRYPWLYSSHEDPKAHILLSDRRGPIGVNVQRGRSHGVFISENAWHREDWDRGKLNDAAFLNVIGRVSDRLGCGVYDSAAGLGTATLYRFWEERGLPKVIRLPAGLEHLFLAYRIGGRVENDGVGEYYSQLHEDDIKSAYPTAVALGLPWGKPFWIDCEPARDYGARCYFGRWRVRVHEDIEHSPIPYKDWQRNGQEASWRLPAGAEFEYAGWDKEIDALRATGRASVQWLTGYAFSTLSTALEPWVEYMSGVRGEFERAGDADAAAVTKLATNSGIGRWGMDPARMELVDLAHCQEGDYCIEYPSWGWIDAPNGKPPTVFIHRSEGYEGSCIPLHWSSYTRMVVRMEIHARAQATRGLGYTVVSVNFDAIVATGPVPIQESEFTWKEFKHEDAQLPYPRAMVSFVRRQEPGVRVFVRKLPGMAQAMAAKAYPDPVQPDTVPRASPGPPARGRDPSPRQEVLIGSEIPKGGP